MRVEQDGGRFGLVDVDPHAHEIGLEPVLDVERPTANTQGCVRTDDKDRPADARRS
jgi:hypothetical protein